MRELNLPEIESVSGGYNDDPEYNSGRSPWSHKRGGAEFVGGGWGPTVVVDSYSDLFEVRDLLNSGLNNIQQHTNDTYTVGFTTTNSISGDVYHTEHTTFDIRIEHESSAFLHEAHITLQSHEHDGPKYSTGEIEYQQDKLQNGTITDMAWDMLVSGVLDFQEEFGSNVIIQVDFNVAPGSGAEHSHFVYIPENGQPQIISGNGNWLTLEVLTGNWVGSAHDPASIPTVQTFEKISVADPEQAWAAMSQLAEEIHKAQLPYGYGQNSNSVAYTMSLVAGFEMAEPKPGGYSYSPGENNDLRDELEEQDERQPHPNLDNLYR